MALAFRNFARLSVPVDPINFNRWGGNALYPRLFVALYFFCSIKRNSPGVIKCGLGSVNGEYLSGITSSLKNISLLKAVNALTGTWLSLVFLYFSICQNYFGFVFKMFGSSCCSCALLILHVFLNFLYASLDCSCFLPCWRFFYLYSRLAYLQIALNQGARCFAHWFGFL